MLTKKNIDISGFIKNLVNSFISKGYAPNAYEINNGQCEDFAWIIECEGFGEMLWQDQLEEITDLTWGEYKDEIEGYCHHCFILYNGKFYDAECPSGVEHPKDLPLFAKHLKKVVQL